MSFKSVVLMVMSTMFLFSTPSILLAENSVGAAITKSTDKVIQEDISDNPLEVARKQIEKAISFYKEGDLDASNRNLGMAIESLKAAAQDSTTNTARDESRQLGIKIDAFKKKLNHESKLHENSLMRFWHHTVSIIKRETDHLIYSYNELSVSEKTLKYLIDAKMHLFIAKHDLFIAHDDESAMSELNNVLGYLEEARPVAKPSINEKIIKLTETIYALESKVQPGHEVWKDNDLVLSLKQAGEILSNEKDKASPRIKMRIELLEADILSLRSEVERNNIKHDYELAIIELKQIIDEL